jgi:DNA-binding response OmpR family regulator
MDKICFDTSDALLFRAVKEALCAIGAFEVAKSGGKIALRDAGAELVLGGGKVIKKPFSIAALAAMLEGEVAFSFAGLSVYPRIRKVVSGMESATLTEMESKLLELLYDSKCGLSQDDLMRAAFGRPSASSAKALSTHVYNLRRKLDKLGAPAGLITLANGRYRLSFQ